MRPIKRRQFLQFTGSTLATFGLSHLDVRRQDRYARVLAQNIPRKLALLVGINNYPPAIGSLQGCLTDVELQKQLLIHRFGFNPKDIVTLTNEQATRQGILSAFEEHLIKQAKPGDVVVFHFSGHASRVRDPECNFPNCDRFIGALVPVDRVPVDSSLSVTSPLVQDITKPMLDKLLNALQTEYVTVVLDIDYAGSFAGKNGFVKGVLLASTKPDQEATDAAFNDFYAGAFTYLMTQYLWQQTSNKSFASMMSDVAYTTRLSFQDPVLSVKPGSGYESRPVYFIESKIPPAEAVISKVEGSQLQIWLGGLHPGRLEAFEAGAIFAIIDGEGREQGKVQLESRQGLVGYGRLVELKTSTVLEPELFLQERVRGIPTDFTLRIGLDPSLGSDTAAAKEALQALNRIEAIPSKVGATPSQTKKVTYLQEVNYILSRMTAEYHSQLQQRQVAAELPTVGTLGLFSRGMDWIPSSFGTPDESVTNAVRRLKPKFRSLLAAQLIRLTLNAESSQLNVAVSLGLEEDNVVASVSTTRGGTRGGASQSTTSNFTRIPVGESIQLQIANNESRNFYFTVLIVDPAGQMLVIFPNSWDAPEEATLVSAGQTLRIPDPERDNFALMTQLPKGVVEVLTIASATPLRQGLKVLRSIAQGRGEPSGPVNLDVDAVRVIDSFLDDFNEGSRSPSPGNKGIATSVEPRRISTSQLAVISITFEIT